MDDLISRQTAIDVLTDEANEDGSYDIDAHDVGMILDSLPSAPQWIPVTERLPDEGEKVLATHLGGLNPNRQVIEHIYQNGEFTCGWEMDSDVHSPTFGQKFMGKVIAWMPLPEPPKEAE